MLPIRSLTTSVVPLARRIEQGRLALVGTCDGKKLHGRIAKGRLAGIDRNDLGDLVARATRRHYLRLWKTRLPRLQVQPVLRVRHDEKCRPTERLQLGHPLLVQRDRAPDHQSPVGETYHRHAPRQLHQRHLDDTDHGEDAIVDLGQRAVRRDGPAIVGFGHGLSALRAGGDIGEQPIVSRVSIGYMPHVTRRDFLNGVALAVAAGLTPAQLLARSCAGRALSPGRNRIAGKHASVVRNRALGSRRAALRSGASNAVGNLRRRHRGRRPERIGRRVVLAAAAAAGAHPRPRQPFRFRRSRASQRIPRRPPHPGELRRQRVAAIAEGVVGG